MLFVKIRFKTCGSFITIQDSVFQTRIWRFQQVIHGDLPDTVIAAWFSYGSRRRCKVDWYFWCLEVRGEVMCYGPGERHGLQGAEEGNHSAC